MPRKKIYSEEKQRFTMTLTKTAINWLEKKKEDLKATSLSDVIEKLSRDEKEN